MSDRSDRQKYVALVPFRARYGERDIVAEEAGDVLRLTSDEAAWIERDSPGRISPVEPPHEPHDPRKADEANEANEADGAEDASMGSRAPDAPARDRMVRKSSKRSG